MEARAREKLLAGPVTVSFGLPACYMARGCFYRHVLSLFRRRGEGEREAASLVLDNVFFNASLSGDWEFIL